MILIFEDSAGLSIPEGKFYIKILFQLKFFHRFCSIRRIRQETRRETIVIAVIRALALNHSVPEGISPAWDMLNNWIIANPGSQLSAD